MNGARLIRSDGLEVGYGAAAVLRGVNLELGSGQFVSLLGPNGSGKTTLLRTLSRHLAARQGGVWLQDRPLTGYAALELARIMAVVLTEKAAPPLLSVLEYVALGRYPHTGFLGRLTRPDLEIVSRALAAVKAEDLAGRSVDQLSDGERQKVVLARALAQEPRIMLLDEPTAHLDLKHRMEVMSILRGLCRDSGLTVLAALHDLDVAAKVSDQVVMLKSGEVAAAGRPEDIMTSQAVADLYDFQEAWFSRDLGGIEIQGDGKSGRAFVLAGPGRGTAVYRLLAKKGFALTAGFPAESDLDAHVARALNAAIFFQAEMGRESAVDRAVRSLEDCDFLIDAGGRPESQDPLARTLIQAAVDRRLPILTLEAAGRAGLAGRRLCADLPALIEALDEFNQVTGKKGGAA